MAFSFIFFPFFFSLLVSVAKQNFKTIIMLTLKIKCYSKSQTLPQHHFFVLSKGNNSGRPSHTACPNCFIVSAATLEETEQLYWLTYAMWKGRAFHQYLRGSVIPFISIHEYRKLITQKQSKTAGTNLPPLIAALQALDKKEAAAREQIKLTQQLRVMLFQKHLPG